MNCKICKNNTCIKKGVRNNVQKYYCKTCKKYFQLIYVNRLCTKNDELEIIKLNNEGVGINGIGRLLKMSKSNVVYKLKKISSALLIPDVKEERQVYEVDEMYTYIKNKRNGCYITYALNKRTKKVINMVVGSRTKENIGIVIRSLNKLNPKKICTDRLNIYPALIDKIIHMTNPHKINHIERFNLTLRTHLKRLSRKTICFSKSKEMLENCLRIYLWSKA